MGEPIVVQQNELPRPVIVVGPSGECKVYEMKPAGHGVVGACLNKCSDVLTKLVLQRLRK